jgi:hypothetical protein
MILPSPRQFDAPDVKRSADVFSILSRYTRLRRAGRQYVGLCPFHSERHPSFYVEPARKIWKCFGCGLGGDILAFVMRIESCDFRSALRILARHSTPGNASSVASCGLSGRGPESLAESAARIVASLPSPGFVPACPRCSARMEFRSYRGNRFGGAYQCVFCSACFGPRELRTRLLAERGTVCQSCRVSGPSIQMYHVLKDADPFDPAWIVLLCSGCRGNVRKLLAIQRRVLKGRSPKGADRREAPALHSQSKAARAVSLTSRPRIAFGADAERRSEGAQRRHVERRASRSNEKDFSRATEAPIERFALRRPVIQPGRRSSTEVSADRM